MRHGANKVLATLYRYGPPPTVDALAALMGEDAEMGKWREYMAEMSGLIAKRLVAKVDIPLYSALMGRRQQQTDTRSGQEIVDSIIARRRNRKAARGGETN